MGTEEVSCGRLESRADDERVRVELQQDIEGLFKRRTEAGRDIEIQRPAHPANASDQNCRIFRPTQRMTQVCTTVIDEDEAVAGSSVVLNAQGVCVGDLQREERVASVFG